MKTLVTQSIVTTSHRFLNNVAKELDSDVETFDITSFEMKLASGYGSYNYVMDVEINNKPTTLKIFTHDSVDYDNYKNLEYKSRNYDNWMKASVLSMLSLDFIIDKINEIATTDDE